MKITTSSDWRDALPFETPLLASTAAPGEPTRCAGCGSSSQPHDRTQLWIIKHRHPNDHAGFVRYYCLLHRPLVQRRPDAPGSKSSAPRYSRATTAPRREPVIERPKTLCPDCFVEVPPTGACGMCGQQVA